MQLPRFSMKTRLRIYASGVDDSCASPMKPQLVLKAKEKPHAQEFSRSSATGILFPARRTAGAEQ
jgi:hypothetical protein